MKNPGIYNRLLMMLGLTGVIFVALLITLFLIKREQETLITSATQIQFNKETTTLISLKTETLKSVVYDYTYWDEFIEKIYKSDTNWFSNNITTILKSFHTDYVCVYDTSFNVIHEAASEDFNSRNISSLQTLKKLKQARFIDYFTVNEDGLIEVSAATIHPENDPSHSTTKPYGYLFVAKSWNQKLFNEMTALTGAKIIPVYSTDTVITREPYSIVSDHTLLGPNKEVAARLYFSRPAVSLKLFHGLSRYMIIFMIASILSTLLIFHFSFRKWINKPLILVTQILETRKPSLVDELKQCKGEFKAIATLFTDFIRQKDELTTAKDKAIESEQTYRSLFNHMLNAFAYCKMIFEDNKPVDFVYIDVNQAFETQTGLTNVTGKRISEVIPDICNSDNLIFEKFGRVAQTGIPEQFEYYINALKIWISASVYSTEKDYFVAIFDVITERKLAEIKIREIGLHYQAIIENAPDGIVLLNEQGDFKFISPSAKKIFGYEINDSISVNPASLTHPEDLPFVLSELGKVFASPAYIPTIQYRFADRDGNWKWIESTFRNLFEDQAVNAIVLNFRDITDRKLSEEALHETREFIERIIDSIPVRVFWKDINLNYMGCNTAFAQDAGFSVPSDIIGKNDYMMGWHEQADIYRNDDRTVIASGIPKLNIEEIQTTPDKKTMTLLTNKIPLLNLKGEITGVLGTYTDITGRKNAERELIKARNNAQESDRLKTAFLANMSHEIRTPMNGILGFASLLKEPDLTGEDQQKYISIIEKSGARILNTINDIIDISKIEAGQMEVSFSETNINDQIRFIYNFFVPETEKKGLKLVYTTQLPDNKAYIHSDSEKFYAIFTNLVKNAVKFTKNGGIEFGYTLKPVDSARSTTGTIDFFVKDTGIGIAKDRQTAIFERFVQADVSDKMAWQGSGLGLAITKAYVEMLGGKLWVESTEDQGSTFFFSLPYQPKVTEKFQDIYPSPEKNQQLKKIKILIAEDDTVSDMYLTTALRHANCELLHASTGPEVIEIFQKNPDTDLILMDIKMPEMNGYEATKIIRQTNPGVIIIAQTAHGLKGDRENALMAGCNDYLSKPVNANELLNLINKYFG